MIHPSKRRVGRIFGALAIAGVLATLASCGDSHDDGMAPVAVVTPTVVVVAASPPPASASASTDGFIAFLKTLVPTMPETTLPLDVTTFVAPVSDTALPDPTI